MLFKSVVIQFNEAGNEYVYQIPPGDDPKPGDVVITSINLNLNKYSRYDHGMKAGRVKELSDQSSNRYYLQLVPIEHFERQKRLTAGLQERNRNLEEARNRLNKLVEKHKQETVMGDLLRNSSEARHLYAFINGETNEYEP